MYQSHKLPFHMINSTKNMSQFHDNLMSQTCQAYSKWVGLLSSDQWSLDPLGYGYVSSLGHMSASQYVQCSLAPDISCSHSKLNATSILISINVHGHGILVFTYKILKTEHHFIQASFGWVVVLVHWKILVPTSNQLNEPFMRFTSTRRTKK